MEIAKGKWHRVMSRILVVAIGALVVAGIMVVVTGIVRIMWLLVPF